MSGRGTGAAKIQKLANTRRDRRVRTLDKERVTRNRQLAEKLRSDAMANPPD